MPEIAWEDFEKVDMLVRRVPSRRRGRPRREWHTKHKSMDPGCQGRGRAVEGWRGEAREMIAQLERQRLRLEDGKWRAKRQGGPEGERLEAQAEARMRDIEQRIDDLQASLE